MNDTSRYKWEVEWNRLVVHTTNEYCEELGQMMRDRFPSVVVYLLVKYLGVLELDKMGIGKYMPFDLQSRITRRPFSWAQETAFA